MTQKQGLPAGCHRYGNADQEPVVLLHSSQSNSSQWRELITDLATDYHVLAIDLLGYGQAPAPQGEVEYFRLQQEAERVTAIIQELAIAQPVHLIGHSYGGALVLKLARECPFAIASVAVYEPVAFHVLADPSAARHEILTVAEKMHDYSAIDATRAFVDYWNQAGYFDALPARIQQLMSQQATKVQMDFAALIGEPAALEDYEQITVPCLLLTGRDSPQSAGAVIAALAQVLPDCQLHEVAGGHMAPLTDAGKVNPHLSSFLKAQTKGS